MKLFNYLKVFSSQKSKQMGMHFKKKNRFSGWGKKSLNSTGKGEKTIDMKPKIILYKS